MRLTKTIPVALVAALLITGSTFPLHASPRPAKKKPLAGYTTLTVGKFTVEKSAATQEFPRGQEMVIQSETVERLRKLRLFQEVVDATEAEPSPGAAATAEPTPESSAAKKLRLSGTVIQFDKGSRAARYWIGLGAGAAKVKARFIFQDAATGEEVFRTERQGKFYGTVAFVGGSKEHAVSEAAGDVVDGLIKDIKKNR